MKDNKKIQFFIRHVEDMIQRTIAYEFPCFTEFLMTGELQNVRSLIRQNSQIFCAFWGGDSDCDRLIAGFFPASWDPDDTQSFFPIDCVHIRPSSPKFSDSLNHRDFLGAILNIGMDRSKIGDIRVCENTAYVFCHQDFSDLILNELSTVRHTSVVCEKVTSTSLIPKQEYDPLYASVASPRIDSIVAAITGLSRTKATQLIHQRLVVANHTEVSSVSHMCKDGYIISIRGYGKYKLQILEDTFTRKGKQKIIILKYI